MYAVISYDVTIIVLDTVCMLRFPIMLLVLDTVWML